MRTAKVGSYAPNDWGLYDMHGNVRQWCEDYFGPYEGLDSRDPLRSVIHSEERRVQRGGAYDSAAASCRAAFRSRVGPDGRHYQRGFRVAFRPGGAGNDAENRPSAVGDRDSHLTRLGMVGAGNPGPKINSNKQNTAPTISADGLIVHTSIIQERLAIVV